MSQFPAAGTANFTSLNLDGVTAGSLTHTVGASVTSYILLWPSAQAIGALTNDGAGNLSWSGGGGGGPLVATTLRVGTTTTLDSTAEQSTFLNSNVSPPTAIPYAIDAQTLVTTNSASAAVSTRAIRAGVTRTATANVTDTQTIIGIVSGITVAIDSGHTYTNSNASGISAYNIANLIKTGTGTIASNYSGIRFGNDTTAVTGVKVALEFGTFTAGTATAIIADNVAFSGTWFINQATAGATQLNGSFINALAALGTTATDGFIYAPSCAGAPTGVPTTHTGTVPIVVDTTDLKLYAYIGGAWKSVTLA